MFKEILASTEAAAEKMSHQLMALLKEKEAIAATALARADGTAAALQVLQGSAEVELMPVSTPVSVRADQGSPFAPFCLFRSVGGSRQGVL